MLERRLLLVSSKWIGRLALLVGLLGVGCWVHNEIVWQEGSARSKGR